MRSFIMLSVFLTLYACVQDEGKIDSGSVSDSGTTTGSTSGGSTTGGTSGGVPTDPLYTRQWHLNNTAQDVGSFVSATLNIDSTPTNNIDANIEEVHDAGILGSGIKIAVSDSGVDYSHEDLDANDLPLEHRNYSFVDPARWRNSEAYPSANEAHGTAVAGIVAAEGWNDLGGRGVAPSATFGAFKFILSSTQADHQASYVDKIIDQTDGDFDIFNYSYGYDQTYFLNDYDDVVDAFKSGVEDLRASKGAIYVQSAGNEYLQAAYLSTFQYVASAGNTNATASLSLPYKIITAAVSADGVKSSYSSPGSGVWISGLGGEGLVNVGSGRLEYFPAIYTTDIRDCSSGFSFRKFIYRIKNPFNYGYDLDLNALCDYTNEMNGTSSAAPIVSGVVALMLEANPALTWRDVKYILAKTARVIDYDPLDNELTHPDPFFTYVGYVYDYKWVPNTAGNLFSNWYGFGLVDADAAVAMAASWVPAPLGPLGVYVRTENGAGVWTHTSAVTVAIPEDITTPATSTIAGVASYVIEGVQVRLTTDHPNPEQLAVHLTSPSGTVSRLVLADSGNISSGDDTYYFQTNAFLEEDSGGAWILSVYDPQDIPAEDSNGDSDTTDDGTVAPDFFKDYYVDDQGSITGWAINIHGHL
ncbi:MAG: S8 family serine peptidase [Bdellovibrionota bacterium]